jgi:thiol-disulfide isomerase/thioredoxin
MMIRSTRWCGFCTVFAPVYDKLGEATQNVRSLQLYTFDLSENDAEPSLNVTAFPTLMLFPANNKTGVVFRGERSVRALLEFLQGHVSHQIEKLSDGVLASPDRMEEVEKSLQAIREGLAVSREV